MRDYGDTPEDYDDEAEVCCESGTCPACVSEELAEREEDR